MSVGEIEVRININDVPAGPGSEPHSYFGWLENKLKNAGIPVDGDNLLHGTLVRFDDPNDFGVTIYVWRPDTDGTMDYLTPQKTTWHIKDGA